ncbi:ribosome biogenesis GTPase Der [Candidatus Saccharibacteria bacterium]|nr:ribosome biogenesis GTPase Der [Candidatus Saccharibacteria bacterium]
MKLPVVAIIGQTNAGKSSIFNRLVRKSQAIVAREAGTTRDNVVGKVENRYILIDTAGLKEAEDEFEAHIQNQIDDAVNSADMILIAMDATKYPNHDDKLIAKKALKSGKPTMLLLNKSDLSEALPETEFLSMGVKNPLRVSATTGLNLNELRDKIIKELQNLGFETDKEIKEDKSLKIALIGRPNVGKSSLFNSLAQKQQAIVANLSGTTRDINRTSLKYKGETIELLDTAGLRKPGKREVGIEKFSALRSLAAIEEADVCCLLVDSTEPHSKLDQSLAGEIVKAGKGVILVLTKTDLDHKDSNEILDNLEYDFNFIPFAPVVMTSSVTGKNVTKIFELAQQINKARHAELKTSDLNKLLMDAVASHPPAGLKNTHPKLRYMVQTDTCPPWFVVYGSNLSLLHWSYKRYLERRLRDAFDFTGTPIFFSFRNRD